MTPTELTEDAVVNTMPLKKKKPFHMRQLLLQRRGADKQYITQQQSTSMNV
jgi:hypothetical protein